MPAASSCVCWLEVQLVVGDAAALMHNFGCSCKNYLPGSVERSWQDHTVSSVVSCILQEHVPVVAQELG